MSHEERFPFGRITPLNVPAKSLGAPAEYQQIAGNPVSSRLESAIGNCFPGLEMDHRNLDRRFFPGLAFEFVDKGALLIAVQPGDPDLPPKLAQQITSFANHFVQADEWFLVSMSQGPNGPVLMQDADEKPLSGQIVWRLVRSLEPKEVTITIKRAKGDGPIQTFTGPRRKYIQKDGRLNGVFQAGELTESLCSPWQHDFRDCSCLYWASNHPDISLPAEPATLRELEDVSDEEAAEKPVIWLRRDRAPDANTLPFRKQDKDRLLELDYYEINRRWQELNFVLEGREIRSPYVPQALPAGEPYQTAEELGKRLGELARIELALALEYLYARYSLGEELSSDSAVRDDVTFAKHELLAVAVSEMRHFRWVKQIGWELHHAGTLPAPPSQEIVAAKCVPCTPGKGADAKPNCGPRMRPTEMRPIDRQVLADFISAEQPSGTLEGLYARVFVTLRSYSSLPFLVELVSSIIADGVRHYSRFREIRSVLGKYLGPDAEVRAGKVVRDFKLHKDLSSVPRPLRGKYQEAQEICRELKSSLLVAYGSGDAEEAAAIGKARQNMRRLDEICEALAPKKVGFPLNLQFPEKR